MRILCVTPYSQPEGGGLERYAHSILGRLGKAGHEVHQLCFTRLGPVTTVDVGHTIERIRPRSVLGNTPLHPGLLGHVRQRIRRLRPDVVVGHTPVPFPAEMAFLAAKAERLPYVLTYHAGSLRGSSFLLEVIARMDRLTAERVMVSGSDRCIAVSPYVRDHALRRVARRTTIVPPGVDATRFRPEGPAPEKPSILFVGPLAMSYRWKGLDTLWEAFRLVRKEVPEATLTLVGDGDRRLELERRALGTAGSVRLRGRLQDDELAQAYREHTVTVLPSTTDAESFGMVLAEANACGRPVVASRVGGMPDFVKDGENGLLARGGDPHDLAEKLVRILKDPELAARLGENGRRKVALEHDWDKLTRRTLAVLESAVAGNPPPRAVPRQLEHEVPAPPADGTA
ncbi:MAG TPA: glycosyltransferase family 4 protein [Candidatus Thermoplasmatota archaeon]|nr:glycosyltransferase family 4 protein [Candidatus Thermoplasmatota archaeon]